MTSRRAFVFLALTVTVFLAGASRGRDAHAGADAPPMAGASVTVEFVEPSRYVDARPRCSDAEPDHDLLRYEKALLRGWLRAELEGLSPS